MDSAHETSSSAHGNANIQTNVNRAQEYDLLGLTFMPENGNERTTSDQRNTPEDKEDVSSSSSSCSDTSSSEEDCFQIDTNELSNPSTSLGTLHYDAIAQPASEATISNNEAATATLACKQETENTITLGAKQSPPVQIMSGYDVPDPNRIPASVFARTPTTGMEWSVASNESLFSIQLGNSSFSSEPVFLLGRSGDLTNFSNSQVDPGYSPVTPPVVPRPTTVGKDQGIVQSDKTETANAEAMKDVFKAAVKQQAHRDSDKPSAEGPRRSSVSTSPRSEASAASFQSFAFPILTGEGKNDSIKMETKHPLPQVVQHPQEVPAMTETPKAAPSAPENRWFPCFSCCSFCC